MAFLLNPRVWIALAVAGVLAFTHFFAYRAGKANVREDFDAYKIEQAQLTQAAEKAAREREQSLQKQAATIEEAKDEQIRIIGDQLDTALASLSKRADRPRGDVSKAATACKGSTGAGLYRPDAEFLARLAARASAVAAERDACYRQYEALRN